ncbi:retrovirus-related pol polyprotein from transposon TNT 1-94, partial [Tanacetum coccineum]
MINNGRRQEVKDRQYDGYDFSFSSKDKEVNMAARDSDDALVCYVNNTVEDRIRWFGEADEAFLHDVREDKEIAEVGASSYRRLWPLPFLHPIVDPLLCTVIKRLTAELWIVMLKMFPETHLQFGVDERLSRTFRAESTGIRVEAPKMLWADSVSTTYLIYRIPYFPIGLRIPEEECGSDEMRYSFRDTKSHQSPGGSLNTNEGSKNSGSFEDSGRSDEEYSKDRASSKEGVSETPHVRRSNTKSKALMKCLKFDNGGEYFCVENGIMMLKMVPKTPLQFCVAERLSRTFRSESTGLRAEALKMLWADSVSTAYLIYRIPYVLIGLYIPEEEWRGKDTNLTYLKVFSYNSFVKVKDVCEEAMKCTFIGNGSDEMRYSFRDTRVTRLSEVEILHLWTRFMKPENDSIVAEHGLSSEITQSLGGSSDTSEGSENSGSFEDSRRSDEEDSEDRASSKGGGSETLQVRRSNTDSKAPVRLPAGKKASQRLLMFKVKEEQNSNKRGQDTKSLIHLVKNIKFCSWANLVRILISEGSLSLLKIFGMKSLAAMFTRMPCIERLLALRLVSVACSACSAVQK